MDEPKVITLSDAMRVYNAASAKVQFLCRKEQGAPRFKTGKEEYALDVGAAVADLARAGGDLAVTGIEALAKMIAEFRFESEAQRRSTQRTQNIVLLFGLLFTAIAAVSGSVQAYAALRTPPPIVQPQAPPR